MKKIKVTWVDAIIYGAHSIIPSGVSTMETIGFLEKENDDWLIIKDPKNINVKTGKNHPATIEPTFYCIPKKTIKNIEEMN